MSDMTQEALSGFLVLGDDNAIRAQPNAGVPGVAPRASTAALVNGSGSRLVQLIHRPAAAESTLSTTSLASASDEVAAGEGAFRTCVTPGVWEITKSSVSRPFRPTACARTPCSARSSTVADLTAGTYCAHLST